MKYLPISMEIRFYIPHKSLTLNGHITGIIDNLPDIGKALFVTLMKAFESKVIKQYLEKSPERYVRNGHEGHERSFCTSF